MPFLGSVITHLILAVTLVLAAAVAGLMAYHYAKARLRERQGYTFDPEAEEPVQPSAADQRAKSAEEIAQIRARIEALMEQQHVRSETQSQHLAQKLDEIRTHMSTQDRKMDGIKSELRHEIRRRDSELDDLRFQLAGALDAFWKSMPALPGGEPTSEARALPSHAQAAQPPPAEPAPDEAPPFVATSLVEEPTPWAEAHPPAPPLASTPPPPVAWSSPFEEIPLEDVPMSPFKEEAPLAATEPTPTADTGFAEPASVEATPTGDVPHETFSLEEASLEDASMVDAAPQEETPFAAPHAEEPPVPEALPLPAPPASSAPASWNTPFASGDGSPAVPPPTAPPQFAPMEAAPAPPAAPPPEPPPTPTEGDDLTAISGITPELQQRLYAAGVTTLDEVARWSRADARRISGLLNVSEEVIMHQWIFEAQSALFEHYQSLMTQ